MTILRSGILRAAATALCACALLSCNNNNDSSNDTLDVGDNDINTVVCIGDSITQGQCAPAGAPYPSRLGALSGKSVVNSGVCGEESPATANRAPGVLAKYKPGYMCLLVGANDASNGEDPTMVSENIRSIIHAARAQKTVPIVATLTPTFGSHEWSNDQCKKISAAIRQVASEEGVRLVDLEKEFGSDASLVQDDGLHPSDSGTQLIALSFNDKI